MRLKDLDQKDFFINRRSVKPLMNCRKRKAYPVLGFDTETGKKGTEFEGKCVLIADSDGRNKIVYNIGDLIDFMYSTHKYRYSINFFYNMVYDVNSMLKFLSHEDLITIMSIGHVTVMHNGKTFSLEQIPDKLFKISELRYDDEVKKVTAYRSIKFFDIMRFFNNGSLENTYKKQTGKEYKKRISAENGFSHEEITDDVIQYCIEDSKACQEIALKLTSLVNQYYPLRSYYSSASIGKMFLRLNMDKNYKFKKSVLQNFALKSYAGGRFEVIQRGLFENAYMYDINSAYPNEIAKLKGVNGVMKKIDDYEPDSDYSFFRVDADIDEPILSPLKKFLEKKNLLAYPNGKFDSVYITKKEYELLKELDIKVKILEGYHLFDSTENPFEYFKELYMLRSKYKKENDDRQIVLKIAMNSAYGLNVQTTVKNAINYIEKINNNENDYLLKCGLCGFTIYRAVGEYKSCPKCKGDLKLYVITKKIENGQFFCPAMASEITANVRTRLFSEAIAHDNQEHILMFATDSITYDKKVNHLPINDDLGNYSVSPKKDMLIIGSGIYTGAEDTGDYKSKFRGFGKYDILDILRNPNEKFYDKKSKTEITKNGTHIKFEKKSPNKLKQVRTHLEDLNVFTLKEKNLFLNFDRKRIWDYEPKDFDELLDMQIGSKPLVI